MILFVRCRNHFPVAQFQNQAHIRNPHGTGQVFNTIWSALGAPIFLLSAPKTVLAAAPSGLNLVKFKLSLWLNLRSQLMNNLY